jgi:hypothetical protein
VSDFEISPRALGFPSFAELCEAAAQIPAANEITSRQIESVLAKQFNVPIKTRRIKNRKGTPVWRNYIDFVLVRLQRSHILENIRKEKAADGGTMSIYRRPGGEQKPTLRKAVPSAASEPEAAPGALAFPAREVLCDAVIELLIAGPLKSRQIEDLLANRFQVTDRDRQPKLESGCPVWRNQVAWALAPW